MTADIGSSPNGMGYPASLWLAESLIRRRARTAKESAIAPTAPGTRRSTRARSRCSSGPVPSIITWMGATSPPPPTLNSLDLSLPTVTAHIAHELETVVSDAGGIFAEQVARQAEERASQLDARERELDARADQLNDKEVHLAARVQSAASTKPGTDQSLHQSRGGS